MPSDQPLPPPAVRGSADAADATGSAGAAGVPLEQPSAGNEQAASTGKVAAPRPRHHLVLVTAPIIVMVIAVQIGNAFQPYLAVNHPLWLVALNPSNRNFLLASNQLDPWSFYSVGALRLLAPDPFFFLLGRWYGEAAILWMERRTPSFGQIMRVLERWFPKASWPLVAAIPNNPVCLLGGAVGMGVGLFAALDLVGTAGRLVLLRVLGKAFQTPIDWVLHLLQEYRVPLLVLSIALVALTSIREWRAGTSPIERLLELEDEVEPNDAPAGEHRNGV